ncbi:MAG: 16S rRNA (guanine(527)-N(7))-methyltransferase RsmG [Spirochaetaceae bacterium]|nr:16S rRNA (guanine(527)-N(7))-methyltransferase RsmG [Spirochaetaceae bacterium]
MDGTFAGSLSAFGIEAEKAPLFEKYAAELNLFNSAYDLVGADSVEDILTKHILDSLAAVPLLKQLIAKTENPAEPRIADVGSGGGLPGIPLAITFPNAHFTLIERMSKRCTVLENCMLTLGLKNVEVLNTEAERAPQKAFDIVVFRAFRPLDEKMTKTLLKLPAENGFIAAYKAKLDKINAEMAGIAKLVPSWCAKPLDVPFLGAGKEERERNLVIIPEL